MLISIEGCIGAGKTTVASGLAAFRRSQLLLEDFEANPFLRAFYEDPVGAAIETEFTFLLLHFHQLKGSISTGVTSEVVSDFHLGKDLLYSDLNLKGHRLSSAFRELYNYCVEHAPAPDLMVFLSASDDLILNRIRLRNRDFEQEITPEYYATLNQMYETFYRDYPGRKLRVSMDENDFVADSALYGMLAALVNDELATGS